MAMDAKAMQTGRNEKMCQQVNGADSKVKCNTLDFSE